MRGWLALAAAIGTTTIACESVVGDFTQYKALPKDCNPTKATNGAPEFLDCMSSQKCTRMSMGFQCSSGVGSTQRGGTCAQDRECATGLNCVFGHCYAYCEQTGCNDNEVCRPSDATAGGHALGACTPANCNPFNPTDSTAPYVPCSAGIPCHFVDSTFVQCNVVGSKLAEGSCGRSADCGTGLFCIFFDSNGLCKYPCRTSLGNADCATKPKKTCSMTKNGFIVDGVDYGYCN